MRPRTWWSDARRSLQGEESITRKWCCNGRKARRVINCSYSWEGSWTWGKWDLMSAQSIRRHYYFPAVLRCCLGRVQTVICALIALVINTIPLLAATERELIVTQLTVSSPIWAHISTFTVNLRTNRKQLYDEEPPPRSLKFPMNFSRDRSDFIVISS